MKHGSRLLFTIAVLLFAVGLVQGFQQMGDVDLHPFGPENRLQWEWLRVLRIFLNAIAMSAWPLLGSMIINRADQWLGRTDGRNSNGTDPN